MQRQVVYVVCAEEEESLAERLAVPLKEAGYHVAHNGTITVGESLVGEAEKALESGCPIVLCATARAIGSSWAHRIINAAHGSSPVRVFVVQMERQAYVGQLALDGKIARYCDDPAKAIDDLLAALTKNYPVIQRTSHQREEPSASAAGHYLDQLTDSTGFDIEALEYFRAELRKEFSAKYPPSLNAWEFLDQAGLRAEGRLTRLGTLLFGKNSTIDCPSAIVKCTRYFGTDRAASRDIETFEGTVPAQIIAARQFVADRARTGEGPRDDQAQSADVYDYPMVAVREIIANALVHRDYASTDACVHVRLFADRLEVSSPGSWLGRDLTPRVEYDLSSLEGVSIKRNFRLAQIISGIRLAEGDGSGIPTALRACEDTYAPIPVVIQENGFITVVLRRAERQANPLLQRLVRQERERANSFAHQVSAGHEITYEGEDRDWLLGLTRETERTIDAISLATVNTGMRGFDGGLWTSDLGVRYLELQRQAIAREVSIRRIFVFDHETLAHDESFQRIAQMQRDVGVAVRMLDHRSIPDWLRSIIFDFILFDGSVGYETTPATAFVTGRTRPIVRTLLAAMPTRIRELQNNFEQLWKAADPEREIGYSPTEP